MMKGSIDSVESFGLVDGPGIRTVIFLTGCKLRCKYCHNPETWIKRKDNIDTETLLKKIRRFKPYFRNGKGGVTFSGGEPLLQPDFLIEMCDLLKRENIHVALDTAGVGIGKYEEILKNVDLVILDIKHVDSDGYKDLTGANMNDAFEFLRVADKMNKKFWLRQVIVPGIMDNDQYITRLNIFIKKNFTISNIEKIEFLPFHTLGKEKYERMGIPYPLGDLKDMDEKKCEELYKKFMNIYNE